LTWYCAGEGRNTWCSANNGRLLNVGVQQVREFYGVMAAAGAAPVSSRIALPQTYYPFLPESEAARYNLHMSRFKIEA